MSFKYNLRQYSLQYPNHVKCWEMNNLFDEYCMDFLQHIRTLLLLNKNLKQILCFHILCSQKDLKIRLAILKLRGQLVLYRLNNRWDTVFKGDQWHIYRCLCKCCCHMCDLQILKKNCAYYKFSSCFTFIIHNFSFVYWR